jgi:NADH:ubiquinone reductase (H+-translocating)
MIWPLTALAATLVLILLAVARAGRQMVAAPMVAAPSEAGGPGKRDARRSRVVVVGGGFGGVYAARALERALGQRGDFEVVLISQDNYFTFQPMLPEVISGTIGLTDTVSPLRELLPRTEVHVREVLGIDLERRVVSTSQGFHPHAHEIAFDHLVLALGSVTDFRGMRGLPEHARPFKSLADALALRNHLVRTLEEAAIERDQPELVQQLLTFVVAGGGFSGVEIAAELNDFVRAVGRRFRGLDLAQIRVVLLHGQDRILPEIKPSLGQFAHRILTGRGVEIRLNARLEAATAEAAVLKGGERIGTRTLVSTVPSSPHPVLDAMELPKGKNGRIEVDGNLQVVGHPAVWALGDCAFALQPDGQPVPPTAQHATRQAEVVAHNIVAALRGGATRTFAFGGLGKMGSLGHRSAVAEIFGLKLSGFVAWFIWRTIYLLKLPGWGRRFKVAAAWTLDLFLPPDLVQLRLGSMQGISREHFEPGEAVFHQGDLGDKLYILLGGEAEVIREEPGREAVVVAKLGPGEFFGEIALLKQAGRSATVRCTKAIDALSLPKREFGLLTTHLAGLRQSFEKTADRRNNADAGGGHDAPRA